MNPIFRFSTWDFETVLKTTAFIDRSLLLRTMLEENDKVLIIAPRLSGKSTNLNMAKRFLQINVDKNGLRENKSKTLNFKLFVGNNLKIFNHDPSFFNDHFGTYPVILIDYHSLSAIKGFNSLTEQYKEILLNTFQHHQYLRNNFKLWSNGKSRKLFDLYSLSEGNWTLTESEVLQGIPLLSELLYEHFGKHVFILLDEYDALVDSPILRDSPDKDQIISFVYKVNSAMFYENKYVSRVFVSGVIRPYSSRLCLSITSLLPGNIKVYHFHNYNPFCEYYGVTTEELSKLLCTFIKDSAKRSWVKSIITEKSQIVEHKNNLFNTWCVLRLLANLNKTQF